MASIEKTRAAKARAQKMLASDTNVNGVGIRRIDDGFALQINVIKRGKHDLPSEIDGVPVVVEEVGVIRPLRGRA